MYSQIESYSSKTNDSPLIKNRGSPPKYFFPSDLQLFRKRKNTEMQKTESNFSFAFKPAKKIPIRVNSHQNLVTRKESTVSTLNKKTEEKESEDESSFPFSSDEEANISADDSQKSDSKLFHQ